MISTATYIPDGSSIGSTICAKVKLCIETSCIETSEIVEFILNVPTDYKLGFIALPLKRRLWIALRKIGEQYYNLDSKLESPLCLGNDESLLTYLRTQLKSNDRELFIVVQNDVERAQKWLKSSNDQEDSGAPASGPAANGNL